MASEHCQRTSDFLSYWPGLAFQQLWKIEKTNDVTENLNEEDVDVHIHTIILHKIIRIENI